MHCDVEVICRSELLKLDDRKEIDCQMSGIMECIVIFFPTLLKDFKKQKICFIIIIKILSFHHKLLDVNYSIII